MSIFEKAARQALRFDSGVGYLTTEQLWDLPLKARGGRPDLDQVARAAYRELKALEEESFVDTKPNPRKAELELKLEVVKYIIDVRLKEQVAAEKAVVTLERKRRLMAALASKEDEQLAGMTREQIEAEIAALGA